jgi:hypothetical protein
MGYLTSSTLPPPTPERPRSQATDRPSKVRDRAPVSQTVLGGSAHQGETVVAGAAVEVGAIVIDASRSVPPAVHAASVANRLTVAPIDTRRFVRHILCLVTGPGGFDE